MDHEQFDILLSAYLDGELTATEQVRVEQLLVSSPEARQLVEELRALRAGLQALPQLQLEANFADRVLQLAESASANSKESGGTSGGIEGAIAAVSTGESEKVDKAERRPQFWRNPRGLAWAAVAVAIALMISMANRPAEQRQVAQGPKSGAKPELAGQKTAEMKAVPESGSRGASTGNSGFAITEPRVQNSTARDLSTKEVADKSSLADSNGTSVGGAAFGIPLQADAMSRNEAGVGQKPVDALATQTLSGKTESPANELLVFEVQVSPEAAKNGEFDRLLAANKIQFGTSPLDNAGHLAASDSSALGKEDANKQLGGVESKLGNGAQLREHDAEDSKRAPAISLDTRGAVGAGQAAAKPSEPSESEAFKGDVVAGDRLQNQKDKTANDSYWYDQAKALSEVELRKLAEVGNADIVYVEATPQQIAATINALHDIPNSFKVVSTEPEVAKKSGLANQLRREVVDRAPRSQAQPSNDAGLMREDQSEATERLGKIAGEAGAGANRYSMNSDQPAPAEGYRLRSLALEQQASSPTLGRAMRLNLSGRGIESQPAAPSEKLAENAPTTPFAGGRGFGGRAASSGDSEQKMMRRAGGGAATRQSASSSPQRSGDDARANKDGAVKTPSAEASQAKDALAKEFAPTDLPSLDGPYRQKAIFVLRVAAPNSPIGAAAANASAPVAEPTKEPAASPAAQPAPAAATPAK
jgi:hypothetical protein